MALPILDGNQTATTLATTVSGGAHYPNHIIASGTVTASNLPVITNGQGDSPLTGIQIGFYDAAMDIQKIVKDDQPLPVSIDSVLPISGTVTANVSSIQQDDNGGGEFMPVGFAQVDGPNGALDLWLNVNQYRGLPIKNQISSNDLLAEPLLVSGTVTANVFGSSSATSRGPIVISDSAIPSDPKYIMAVGGLMYTSPNEYRALRLGSSGGLFIDTLPAISGTVTVGNSVTISSLPAISGTVTANNPSGSLTTRFGSVTTANTAQLTAAVTNSARKYLLAQNISAGTVTIGIGFSPTTTQGIQLSAGGGLSFDAFCPTGAVWWLSATTGANFTILEG